jgi:hypothetical protein
MKYVKLFENNSGYTAYTADTENFVKPNVSYCVQENECHMTPNKEETLITLGFFEDGCDVGVDVYFSIEEGAFEIRLLVDGEPYPDCPCYVTDGKTSFYIFSDFYGEGAHTVEVIFDGNSKYLPCRASDTVELPPCP